ncbi:MAG: tetratricopeptide repeat protein [Bacteroidia bacterium]|nr:tetratricopeptide repeat protein [Bacteroidia bacterium]
MKKRINILISAVIILLCSCQPESERTAEKIKETEKKLINDSTKMMNRPLAEDQLKAYANFIEKFPDDKRCEEYLYKAADLANGMGKTAMALEYYHRFGEKYPASQKAAYALFLQAFIHENQLKNMEKAKELYTSFLSKYPDHELAKDAQFSLDNLGKSEEDLIKMFEEKNKDAQASSK